jgi:hypothetical protein
MGLEMTSKEGSESRIEIANGAGIGIAIGAGIGLIFGVLTDNIGLAVGFGAALGLVFGSIFTYKVVDKNRKPKK